MTEELWREARSDEDDEAILSSPGHPSDGIGLVRVPAEALLIEDGFDRAAKRMSRSLYEIIQKVGKLTEDRTLDQLCGALLHAAAGEGEG